MATQMMDSKMAILHNDGTHVDMHVLTETFYVRGKARLFKMKEEQEGLIGG